MASIQRVFSINAKREKVWSALRDVANPHELFRGVVTATQMEEGARVVTFANGATFRELIVDIDDASHRFAYAVVGGNVRHHNASFQLESDGDATRVIWITDVLPNELSAMVGPLMDAGIGAMKRKLEG